MTTQRFDALSFSKDVHSVCNLNETELSDLVPRVSIVIPAKNEGRNLQLIVEKTVESVSNSEISFEILLVDDGSWDNTSDILSKLATNDSRVVWIKNHSNYGKGFSLRKGFKMARGELIITMDADGQHPPEEIPRLIEPIFNGKADLVIGSRFLKTNNGVPARHWLGNKVVSLCFNLLYRSDFSDVLLGFRAFRKDAINELKLDFNGYLVEVEMLADAVKKNVKITQIQTRCTYSRKSSLLRGIGIVGKIVAGIFFMRITRR